MVVRVAHRRHPVVITKVFGMVSSLLTSSSLSPRRYGLPWYPGAWILLLTLLLGGPHFLLLCLSLCDTASFVIALALLGLSPLCPLAKKREVTECQGPWAWATC